MAGDLLISKRCECCGEPPEGADFGTPDARRLDYGPFCQRCWSFIDRGWTVSQIRRKVIRRPAYAKGAAVHVQEAPRG